jgi:hypothetical protein
VATLLLLALVWPDLPHRSDDSFWYLQMAEGATANVPAPFAGRLVHTGLARLLTGAGLDADRAFLATALPAVWMAFYGILLLHRRGGVAPAVTALVAVTWFSASLLRDATLPDAQAAAWLVLFLLAAARGPAWSLPVLVVAVACRESLALMAVVWAVLAWQAGRRRAAAGALAAAAAGLVLVALLSGAANVHAMGGPPYLVAKAGFNLSRNLAGWELRVPTIDYCEPSCVWSLPSWLPTGAIDRVGVCGFNARRPLWLLVAWSGTFGVVPGWLWGRRRDVRRAWRTAPLWLRAALVYGLVAAALAPAAGTMLVRLTGYGWPAFWLAAPLCWGALPRERRVRGGLVALQLAAAWLVPFLAAERPLDPGILAGVALLGLLLNAGAAVLARRTAGPTGPNAGS